MHEGILPLAQSSKRATIPQNYIALVGDSYAQGFGDWFITADKNRNPDFHSAHIIHRRTGKDVISYGHGGLGSLTGIVRAPIGAFEFINATLFFKLELPQWILVYFYEGNDLNNNLRHLREQFDPTFDQRRIYEPEYFRGFIETVVHPKSKPLRIRHNLFVTWMAQRMLRKENRLPEKKREKISVGKINQVLINDKVVKIPDRLQSPALELTEDEIHLALYVFEQSLLYLHDYFPEVQLGIVYIPSVLSSYQIASPQVSIATYEERSAIYPQELVRKRSDRICSLVEEIASRHHLHFIDSRPVVWEVSVNQSIHGPLNWGHFNKEGYTALAEATLMLLDQIDNSEND